MDKQGNASHRHLDGLIVIGPGAMPAQALEAKLRTEVEYACSAVGLPTSDVERLVDELKQLESYSKMPERISIQSMGLLARPTPVLPKLQSKDYQRKGVVGQKNAYC